WRVYLPAGRTVVSLRWNQAYSQPQAEAIQLGGTGASFSEEAFALPVLNQREFPLRGYRSGEPVLTGHRASLATLEWRIPVSDVDRHLMVPPVGVNRISMSVFTEAGAAWDNAPQHWYKSGGVELLYEARAGYLWGAQLGIGVAKGFEAPRGTAPGPAQIVEHRAPHAEQAERVPVRVDASLDVEQQAAVAGLVAARISAQTGVASQGQLAGSGGVLEGVAGERDERQGPAGRVAVESNRAAYPLPVEGRVAGLPGERGRAQQDPVRRKPKAVARAGGVEPEILRRAKAGQRAAELNAGLGSHREGLGTLDQIPV